ncbi:uncharacterized protein LOC106170642 [Lingula anatina]|uniref:Uncharacterized protein LOC106170642 n=1 Tax=Lingula anatina TaxID=7574 RepID=A0A1S3J6M5_LINAN|nr:uncharacterized protein LOC106170642 [Lingula anatina]|eukprot:XP_013406067.1 uncharacterized protein LOC106170642 [Lingula anatina]
MAAMSPGTSNSGLIFFVLSVFLSLSPIIAQYCGNRNSCSITGYAENICFVNKTFGCSVNVTDWHAIQYPQGNGAVSAQDIHASYNNGSLFLNVSLELNHGFVNSTSGFEVHISQGGGSEIQCVLLEVKQLNWTEDELQQQTIILSLCMAEGERGPNKPYKLAITTRPQLHFTLEYFTILNNLTVLRLNQTAFLTNNTATTTVPSHATRTPVISPTGNVSKTVSVVMETYSPTNPSSTIATSSSSPVQSTSSSTVTGVTTTSTVKSSTRSTVTTTSQQTKTAKSSTTIEIKTTMDSGTTVAAGEQPSTKETDVIQSRLSHVEETQISIILGSILGVGLAVVAIGMACLCYRRRRLRQDFQMQRFEEEVESFSSNGEGNTFKTNPSVLLLYSYDCPAHERVVSAFAMYLKEVCGCQVHFDLWDQDVVREKGPLVWFGETLDQVDSVIVICSTGARFKCSQKNKYQVKVDHPIADIFVPASDMVVEKIRLARNEEQLFEQPPPQLLSKYCIVYFDYCTASDVPVKLELIPPFCLMKDIFAVYCQLHGIQNDTWSSLTYCARHTGVKLENFAKTSQGKELDSAVRAAKDYFRNNKNWLQEKLEPLFSLEPLPLEPHELQPSLQDSKQNSSQTNDIDPKVKVKVQGQIGSGGSTIDETDSVTIKDKRTEVECLDETPRRKSRHRQGKSAREEIAMDTFTPSNREEDPADGPTELVNQVNYYSKSHPKVTPARHNLNSPPQKRYKSRPPPDVFEAEKCRLPPPPVSSRKSPRGGSLETVNSVDHSQNNIHFTGEGRHIGHGNNENNTSSSELLNGDIEDFCLDSEEEMLRDIAFIKTTPRRDQDSPDMRYPGLPSQPDLGLSWKPPSDQSSNSGTSLHKVTGNKLFVYHNNMHPIKQNRMSDSNKIHVRNMSSNYSDEQKLILTGAEEFELGKENNYLNLVAKNPLPVPPLLHVDSTRF